MLYHSEKSAKNHSKSSPTNIHVNLSPSPTSMWMTIELTIIYKNLWSFELMIHKDNVRYFKRPCHDRKIH